MDTPTAVLLGSIALVACVLALRLIGAWEGIARRKVDGELARSSQFAALARKSHEARRANKRRSKEDDDEDDEEGEDPLASILAHPVARMAAARYGINADALAAGDDGETEKVVKLLNTMGKGPGSQQTQGALL